VLTLFYPNHKSIIELMNKQLQMLLVILSLFLFDKINAQNTKVDSLENVLKINKTDDTIKVNLLNQIAYLIYQNDSGKALNYATQAGELSDKLFFLKGKAESLWVIGTSLSFYKSDKLALEYFLKALKIAKEINFKLGIVKYLISSGINYATTGNISAAMECYEKAMKISEELKNKPSIARCLGNMCIIYTGQGNYKKAIEGYQRLLIICEEIGDKKIESMTLNNMGNIYQYQGNNPKALEYFLKSLKIKEETNDKQGIIYSYVNIGSVIALQSNYPKALEYFDKALKIAVELNEKRLISQCFENIGDVYLQSNNLQALDYLQKALVIAEELSYTTPMITISTKIGDFYRAQSNYGKALEYYKKALSLSEEMKRKRTICEIWSKMGAVYLAQKEYSMALSYTLKSLDIANEMKLLTLQRDIHNQLSEIYAATNDYRNAYTNHKLYKELNDSIYKKENVKKIIELEYTYKFEKEKQAIELEQQKKDAIQAAEKRHQRVFIFSLIAGFILLSVFTVYVYRSYQAKHKTNIILTKQKLEIEDLNEEYQALNEELKQSNEQLYYTKQLVEESEEKLRLLIKNSNDIFVQVNEKGEQFFISDVAKDLTGYNIEELLGSVNDVVYPDDIEIVLQHWKRVLSDKNTPDTVQYRHKHKEKGYVWFEAVAQNFLDHPAIKSIVANVRDITERKRIEQALKESKEEKARLLELEIERINRELESNQKSMTAATLKLVQNSERDAQTIERLIEVEKNTNSDGKSIISKLISDYKRLSYNSNWDEFEILFEKVHSSFYERLNTLSPNLTANERKICAFLKLNMSNKDIAQITFQSEEALKKARLRLRQKLGIDREVNLVTFIQSV